MPTGLDQVETSILAAALETIDRVGPCRASLEIEEIEDIRIVKRQKVIERAKTLFGNLLEEGKSVSDNIIQKVREEVEIQEIISYGADKLPAGPNVPTSEIVIVVEGRNDVLNLLKYGVKNAIAVEGTNIPKTIQDISKEKVVTAFLDGDRGGDLILRELIEVAELDFVARAPAKYEVEELTYKQMVKALKNKLPIDQYLLTHGINNGKDEHQTNKQKNEIPDKKTDFKHNNIKPMNKVNNHERNKDNSPILKMLNEAYDKKNAKFLDASSKEIGNVSLNELVEKLKNSKDEINTIVMGGIISQRLVDIAYTKGVKRIIGIKMSNVTKKPMNMKIITRDYIKGNK